MLRSLVAGAVRPGWLHVFDSVHHTAVESILALVQNAGHTVSAVAHTAEMECQLLHASVQIVKADPMCVVAAVLASREEGRRGDSLSRPSHTLGSAGIISLESGLPWVPGGEDYSGCVLPNLLLLLLRLS